MSTAVKVKKPFLPQRKPVGPVGNSVAVSASAGPRLSPGAGALTIGGEPRVHLLPVDVIERKKLKIVKRRVATGVVLALVLCGIAGGAASLSLDQAALTAAQSQTSQLLAQEGKYGQVNKIKTDIASIKSAQKTGTVQEILWSPFVTSLQATLPAGASLTQVTAAIDSPFSTTDTEAVPLVGAHIATVNLTLVMPQNTIPTWLNSLSTLKGFVTAVPDSVTNNAVGTYNVTATIYLNEAALSDRFGNTGAKTATTSATSTTTGGTN